MRNIDRYDEEVKNIDIAEVERLKRKRDDQRAALLFAAKLFVFHIAAFVIYVIIFSPASDAEVAHDTSGEAGIIAFFSALAITFFSFFISLELSSKGELRRDFTDRMKKEKMSLKLFWELSGRPILTYAVIYFIFQLPFVVFYHFFGFSYVYPTLIDKFFTLDAGFMELTGIGIVGAILSTLMFTALHAIFRFFTYRRWKSEIL